MKKPLALALASALSLSAPAYAEQAAVDAKPAAASVLPASNPFAAPSTLPYQYPPFDKVKNEHFAPGFDAGMKEQLAEVEAIANSKDPPTFANTIVPLERSGQTLSRVQAVFFSMAGANTNDEIQKIQTEYAPKLSAHGDAIALNGKLFERVKAI